MTRKTASIALTLVLFIGVFLRWYRLDDRSIWYDEAFSYTLVHEFTWSEMFTALRNDVHPPLYFILLRLWSLVCGVSPLALRGFSILMGAVTIGGIYLVTRDLVRLSHPAVDTGATGDPDRQARTAGISAATLLAVFSSHIWWSQDAKMYSLATAFIAFNAWFLIRAVVQGRPGDWIGFALTAVAMLYTHNYALFTLVGECAFLAAWYLVTWPAGTSLRVWRELHRAALAVAVVGLAYLPWFPTLLAQSRRVKSDYWITPTTAMTIPYNLDLLIFPGNDFSVPDWRAITLTSGLLALVIVLLALRRPLYWLTAALVLTPIACAWLVSVAFASIITPRYFLFSVLFVPTAIATLCSLLIPRFAWNVTAVLGLASLLIHFQFLECLFLNERGTYGIVQQVLKQHEPGQPVIVTNAGVYFSVKYYAQNELKPKLLVSGQEIPHYLGGPILRDTDTITARQLDELPEQELWVIDSTGFSVIPAARSKVPDSWTPVPTSRVAYREVFSWQGRVSSELYRRRRS